MYDLLTALGDVGGLYEIIMRYCSIIMYFVAHSKFKAYLISSLFVQFILSDSKLSQTQTECQHTTDAEYFDALRKAPLYWKEALIESLCGRRCSCNRRSRMFSEAKCTLAAQLDVVKLVEDSRMFQTLLRLLLT